MRRAAADDAVRVLMKTLTELSLRWEVRKTNLRATKQKNFTWGGDLLVISFVRGLFTKNCVSSAARKGTLNRWL